jgi:cytoskeleton protein RodZ
MTPSLTTESIPETGAEFAATQKVAAGTTAGQLLREARLKSGVHLAVLSVTLKVPVRQLEALEANDLDAGKGPVFYRGLASSVCRHLHTDSAPILALLPQTTAQLQPLRSTIESIETEGSMGITSLPWARMASSKVVWVAALMLLLTGAFLWLPGPAQWAWLDDVKSLMADEVASQQVTEPLVVTPAPVLGPTSPSTETAGIASGPSAAFASAPSLVTASAAVINSQVQPAPPAKPLPVAAPAAVVTSEAAPELVFSATGESWLEVRNAQKAVVWSGVVKAGESARIQSPLPVSVVVGRAQVVTATLRGQPFDLKPHTQVAVARFEVKE